MENVYASDWDRTQERPGFRAGWIRLGRRLGGEMLGATIYVLGPGQKSFRYHLHHANEELILVLTSEVTVRTPGGEEVMAEGDTLLFATGPTGAHQVINHSDADARYIMFSTMVLPDITEHPDSGNVGLCAAGGDLRKIIDGEAAMDYWRGED